MQPLNNLLARGSESERWLSVLLRTVHLCAAVWLGAMVLGAPVASPWPGPLVLASGLVMLVLDLRARRIALGELAGASVLVKLALVAWLLLDPPRAALLFWVLVVLSSLTSHAPKNVRHWPSPAKSGAPRSQADRAGAVAPDPRVVGGVGLGVARRSEPDAAPDACPDPGPESGVAAGPALPAQPGHQRARKASRPG